MGARCRLSRFSDAAECWASGASSGPSCGFSSVRMPACRQGGVFEAIGVHDGVITHCSIASGMIGPAQITTWRRALESYHYLRQLARAFDFSRQFSPWTDLLACEVRAASERETCANKPSERADGHRREFESLRMVANGTQLDDRISQPHLGSLPLRAPPPLAATHGARAGDCSARHGLLNRLDRLR